jgi:hypothetical protein
MKSKMKRQGSTELPRVIVGALATAGASMASGTTVQITFANNVVSSATGTRDFVADLTGDSVNDLVGGFSYGSAAYVGGLAPWGYARRGGNSAISIMLQDGAGASFGMLNDTLSRRGLVPFAFSDGRIGVGTISGWLDMTARAALGPLYEVQIHRLIFDVASTTAPPVNANVTYPKWEVPAVPEPGSNLALLALGAGGLTLRRRLKRAA